MQKTFVVPRERATFQDVWHVMGLKGTGSNTYTLTDVFVPEDYAVDYHALDPAQRREHGPLYKFTIYQLFGSSFPAVALGIARTMLDDFCALAQGKTPQGQTSVLRDSAVVQSQVGVMQSQLAAARAFFLEAWREIWQGAQTGTPTMEQRIRLRMASINVEPNRGAGRRNGLPCRRRHGDFREQSVRAPVPRHARGVATGAVAILDLRGDRPAFPRPAACRGWSRRGKPEASVMFFEERVAELTRKMLRKKLYVVLSKPAVAPDKLQPFLSAHLEYMIGLEKRGHVFASGPLADGEGRRPAPG